MTRVAAVRAVADSRVSGLITATATCPAGQVMLGGGYALSGSANLQSAAILDDYPASVNAWTVTLTNADDDGPLTLTVYADCLLRRLSVTTHMVVTTPTDPNGGPLHTFVTHCPVGAMVTGGGSRDWGFNESPTRDGWQATYIPGSENPPPTATVFAVCASGALQPGVIVSASQAVTIGASASLSVACPADELLVGGGYYYDGLPSDAYVDEPSSDFSSWQVELADQDAQGQGIAGTLTASAVCVRITSASAGR
jgi:hypothetical protein